MGDEEWAVVEGRMRGMRRAVVEGEGRMWGMRNGQLWKVRGGCGG